MSAWMGKRIVRELNGSVVGCAVRSAEPMNNGSFFYWHGVDVSTGEEVFMGASLTPYTLPAGWLELTYESLQKSIEQAKNAIEANAEYRLSGYVENVEAAKCMAT